MNKIVLNKEIAKENSEDMLGLPCDLRELLVQTVFGLLKLWKQPVPRELCIY